MTKRPYHAISVTLRDARSAMKETMMLSSDIQTDPEFSSAERDAVYKCIFNRRDVRGQFLSEPIP